MLMATLVFKLLEFWLNRHMGTTPFRVDLWYNNQGVSASPENLPPCLHPILEVEQVVLQIQSKRIHRKVCRVSNLSSAGFDCACFQGTPAWICRVVSIPPHWLHDAGQGLLIAGANETNTECMQTTPNLPKQHNAVANSFAGSVCSWSLAVNGPLIRGFLRECSKV